MCRTTGLYPCVDGLPNDFLAANITDAIQHFEGILETDKKCMVCLNIKAKMRCLSCRISLCEGCNLDHSKVQFDKDHVIVKEDPSLLCETHGKDLSYVCQDCHKLVCSCCIRACKGHKYFTVGAAMREYFWAKGCNERPNIEFVKNNNPTRKERLQSTFNAVSTSIQKHSDDVIEAVKKETKQMIGYLKNMESGALTILEAAGAGSRDFSEKQLENWRLELPIELIKNLPDLLRSEVQKSIDRRSYALDMWFEPYEGVSIGSVHVKLGNEREDNISPRLYGGQHIGASGITRDMYCGVDDVAFTLDPCGQVFTITDMFLLDDIS